METDENAPPLRDEKQTQAGPLSPFGFLSGVRAMLSPSVKDQTPSEAESPAISGRPVLRDVNMSGSPKPKIFLQVAQGQGAPGSPSLTDGSGHLSPSTWLVKGDRSSVTSESSFVSAGSVDVNSSLVEGIQPSSPYKGNGVESDTDTSTVYESAGETEDNGNSSINDKASAHHSTPFKADRTESDLDDSRLQKSNHTTVSCLNETVLVKDSTEENPGNISVSYLVDHLGGLYLSTPLKFKNGSTPGKAHVTLDSDVSGDIVTDDSVEDEVKECLDTTVTLVDETVVENTKLCQDIQVKLEVNETVIIPSESIESEEICKVTSEQESDGAEDLDEAEDACINATDATVGNSTLCEEEVQKLDSNDTATKCTLQEERDLTSETPHLNPTECLPTDANLQEGFDKSIHFTSKDLQASVISETRSEKHITETIEVSTESAAPVDGSSLNDAETLASGGDEIESLIFNQSESQECPPSDPVVSSFDEAPIPVKNQRTFEEILTAELAAQGQDQEIVESDTTTQLNSVSQGTEQISPKSVLDKRSCESPIKETSSSIEACVEVLETEVQQCADHLPAETVVTSDEISLPVEATSSSQESLEAELAAQTYSENTVPSFASGEATILPKAPRSFEEILEAELAAQADAENAVPSFASGEAVILPKAPRSFEEILEAELAAHSDAENAVPSFSTQHVQSSSQKLRQSFADIIASETTSLEAECEPELVSEYTAVETGPDKQLNSLIEKCKQQELDLQQADTDFNSLAAEASRLSLSCLIESPYSVTSEDPDTPDDPNVTVILVDQDNSSARTMDSSSESTRNKVTCEEFLHSLPHTESFNTYSEEFKSGDSEEFKSADAFKDPSAFDFLSLHGSSRSARDLRKESLYVKFDPLVDSLVSDSRSEPSFTMHPENSSDNQNGVTTALDDGPSSADSPLVSLSPSTASKQVQDKSSASSSATPVKIGAAKSTPVKTPAHAMLNETIESLGSRGSVQEDLIKKLQQHQSVLEEQDKAYQEQIVELEERLQMMVIQREEKDKQLEEKAQSISELRVVMKEYEQTIARIVAEKSQQKAAFEESQVDLIKDRDQAQQHLNNMEISFADIHVKYERLKSVVEAFKRNEESLNAALTEKNASIEKVQNMYDMLKSHAVQKLEKANQDLEAMKQKHQQENAKLKAMVKKLEIKTKSLEEALEQKVKENQALTAICDELINKVGD